MARNARIVLPGCSHHITQRGNHRRQIFFMDEDYQRYLTLLVDLSRRYGVRLDGYCLMPNHTHLLATPATEDGLARVMGQLDQRFSQWLNFRDGITGHRWQNRYFSTPLDATYFLRALRYVERNPVRAHFVASAEDYPWSSAQAHLSDIDPRELIDLTEWQTTWKATDWREYLALPGDPGEVETFRLTTTIGRPLGSESFIAQLEESSGRILRARSVGRPRKEVIGLIDGRKVAI